MTIFSVALRYLLMAALGIGLSAFHEPPGVESVFDPWFWMALVVLTLLGWRRRLPAPRPRGIRLLAVGGRQHCTAFWRRSAALSNGRSLPLLRLAGIDRSRAARGEKLAGHTRAHRRRRGGQSTDRRTRCTGASHGARSLFLCRQPWTRRDLHLPRTPDGRRRAQLSQWSRREHPTRRPLRESGRFRFCGAGNSPPRTIEVTTASITFCRTLPMARCSSSDPSSN